MADPTEAVSGLIERIEAAGEGSDLLDCAVGFELTPDRGSWPMYTRSIDAALSLVPTGRRLVVQQRRSYEPFWVSFMLDGGTEYDATGRAKTLALAITAAALRARETTPSIKGGDRG